MESDLLCLGGLGLLRNSNLSCLGCAGVNGKASAVVESSPYLMIICQTIPMSRDAQTGEDLGYIHKEEDVNRQFVWEHT